MKNPFSYNSITFKLNYFEIQILINLLKSCNPAKSEEELLINTVDALQKVKTNLENES